MNTFITLLKREYWENRAGFLWTPIIVAAVFLVLTLGALVLGSFGDSGGLTFNNIKFSAVLSNLGPEELADLGLGLDRTLAAVWALLQVALYFVVLFYLLAALFDERRDRSVLFWKSLPVSDTRTVLAKAATALLVAPLMAWAVSVAAGLVFLVGLSAYVLAFDLSPMTAVWGPGAPVEVFAATLLSVPLSAVWALPMVGWMLLCSAFVANRPFWWAIGVPALTGLMLTWLGVLNVFRGAAEFYWPQLFLRLVAGVVPGSWMWFDSQASIDFDVPKDGAWSLLVQSAWALMANPSTWIGVVAGAILIWAAIMARRRRSE